MKTSRLRELFAGRLFRRYFVGFSIVAAALWIPGMLLAMWLAYSDGVDSIAREQMTEAQALKVLIEQRLRTVEEALLQLANLPDDPRAMPHDGRRQEFHRTLKAQPLVHEPRYWDRAGREALYVSRIWRDRAGTGSETLDRNAYSGLDASGIGYGDVAYRDGLEPFVGVAVAGDQPGARGVVTALLDLRFVADFVGGLRSGKAGHAYVTDRHGTIIAHPEPGLMLRRHSIRESAEFREASARIARGEGLRAFRTSGERRRFVTANALPGTGWFVFLEQPEAEVLQPVHASLYRGLIVLAVGVLAAFLASLWAASRLSGPILEVRRGAQRFAHGDLGARIEVRTNDEVAALAADFNEMADQIREYTTALERKVEERTAELREALRARALFLAAASHDLRQPLYAISILADTLALESLPQGARETLAKQREAIAVLRGLFDNLLDLSRFDSGEIRMNPRAVPLREVLTPIAIEHEVVCRAKGLAWNCEIADAWVVTDPELVRRIAANLLSNAVRYTPRGSVSLVAEPVGAHVRLVVSDTGIGIAPGDQERVFEEFVQLGNPSRERDRGVGLGLSIVKKISVLLGANLQLTSAPGEGTRISIDIPLAREMPAPELAEPRLAASDAEFVGLRIWAVEDDPLVRSALRAQFEAWGVDYAFAASRAEVAALRESDGGWPDGVMLDDMLGHGEQGLAIGQWLAESMPRERLVLVTGNVEPAAVERLAASGLAVFRKPLATAVLAQWLRAVARAPATTARAAAPAG